MSDAMSEHCQNCGESVEHEFEHHTREEGWNCSSLVSTPCSACAEWREKWLSTRRYLRAANRGAETNALALQICTHRSFKAFEKIQTLQMENRQLRKELDVLKQNSRNQPPR